jgi:hypothetical protein
MTKLCPIAYVLDKTSSLRWSYEIISAAEENEPAASNADVKS